MLSDQQIEHQIAQKEFGPTATVEHDGKQYRIFADGKPLAADPLFSVAVLRGMLIRTIQAAKIPIDGQN